MVNLASFWKPEACGQTILPDRQVILIGQKLVEHGKKNSNETFWMVFKHCTYVYFKGQISLQHCVLQGPLQIGSPFSQSAVQALLPEGSLGPGSQNLHWSRFPPLEPPPKDPNPEPKDPNDPNPDPNPPNRFDAASPQNPQRSQRCLHDPPVNKAKRGLGLSLGQSSQMEQSSIVNSSVLKLCNF